jgi:hypothetical protein
MYTGAGKEPVSRTPAMVAEELTDMVESRDLQSSPMAELCAKVRSIEERPLSHGHARYCQELFDHYKHPRTGKLVHGYGRFSYQALEEALVQLQDRLVRLIDSKRQLVGIDTPVVAQSYQEPLPPYRRPGLLAPPPPPGIAPVEIPVKIPAELIPIPEFSGDEEKEPVFVEPKMDPFPPFEPPEPLPKPELVLKKKGKAPAQPQIRPYPWQPTPMPPLDLQPPLLVIYVYVYVYVFSHTHTYIRVCVYIYIHLCTHTNTHTHTHTHPHIHIYTYTYIYTCKHTHTHTHTRTHIRTYAYTGTRPGVRAAAP